MNFKYKPSRFFPRKLANTKSVRRVDFFYHDCTVVAWVFQGGVGCERSASTALVAPNTA